MDRTYAFMGEIRNVYKILFRKSKEKDNLGDDMEMESMRVWTGFAWLIVGSSDRLL
jgi:hypothetical protein